MVSKVIINMVIKKSTYWNETLVICTIGKHATSLTIADNVSAPTFMRLMN
jgi:hypothetical protein